MAARKTRRRKTDWKRLEHLGDTAIRKAAKADPDAAPVASSEWFRRAKLLEPRPKMPISMRLDEDIVKWFRARGRGYQTRINAVLRAYVESRSSAQKGRASAF
jgi:uncharacterized protein (DUF4415 family)